MSTENKKVVLKAEDVKKYYYKNKPQRLPDGTKRRKTEIRSVDGVSFELREGEILGVLGESGCGKSTLGRQLTGLEDPTGGYIILNGEDIRTIYKRSYKELRRSAQMIFQNPFDVFDSRCTIEKVLVDAMKLHDIGADREERIKFAEKTLESAGLMPAKDFMKRFPNELSGGQLQRISILRSMLLNPAFIVADEPVSMLDVSVRADIINMIRRVATEQKTAVVFISHDIATTKYLADNIAVMYLGQIVEYGTTGQVVGDPQHPYTRALISNCSSTDPREPFNPETLEGDPPSPASLPTGCYFSPRCSCACEECFSTRQELRTLSDGRQVRCAYAAKE